jgi:hypothetical protein
MSTEATDASAANNEAAGEQTATDTSAATDVNAEGTKPEAGAETKTPEAKADDKPIEYEFKAPEGVELDTELVGKFTDIAKELKLPADQAQKVVDLYAATRQAEADAFTKQVETWGNEVKADKEIGGKNLEESLGYARKVIDSFGDDGIKSLLDSTGMGNHPAVVKMLVKVGKAISEDSMVRGATPSSTNAPKDHASILYGKA